MDFDVTVIGAGVVGLAVAAKLVHSFPKLAVIERHEKFGQETSSRNSEVIHSGIYYPQNSLKARLCVIGNQLLYDYCEKNDVSYSRCGKYIVATDEQEQRKLEQIFLNAKLNGVVNAEFVSQTQLNKKEPEVRAIAALHFADTGIIDSWSLMKSFETQILNNGGDICYLSEVVAIDKVTDGYEITIVDNSGEFKFTSGIVINSAGLNSDKISEMAGICKNEYQLHFWKGEYFAVGNGKNKLLKSLVYPVPSNNAGLGVHATIDLGGGLKLGPNAFLVHGDEVNFKVNNDHKEAFYESAKKFLPLLELADLMAHQAGIRPKLISSGKEFRDFVIKNEKEDGFKNFINLIGIESPGLTSCLSIAEYVEKIII